jgi:hypothetical protein
MDKDNMADMHNEYYSATKKECNPAICGYMDGIGDHFIN